MEHKTIEKQRIVSKMHYDNCNEYRKNKNKKDNEYNKPNTIQMRNLEQKDSSIRRNNEIIWNLEQNQRQG